MIIAAFKHGQTKAYTRNAHQFDKGQKLIMTGIALPESFEVHMSNEKEGGLAYSCKGNAEGVYIPDALFVSGEYVYVWLYDISKDHEGSSSGYDSNPEEETIQEEEVAAKTVTEYTTTYEVVIPVTRRSVQLPTVELDPTGTFGYTVDENETLIPVNQ
ncbi:MAG: hypothetical protein IIY33_00240 [Erysipelotrichaceae bacterium]|nr:hypothetical protein [Erysipelotrichaceae bacterium]